MQPLSFSASTTVYNNSEYYLAIIRIFKVEDTCCTIKIDPIVNVVNKPTNIAHQKGEVGVQSSLLLRGFVEFCKNVQNVFLIYC